MMSSPYPVLGNRPIDQWKVTELKEELKRRKLTTRGLKDDLVRRLDEALQAEANSTVEAEIDEAIMNAQSVTKDKNVRSAEVVAETAEDVTVLVTDEIKVPCELGDQLSTNEGMNLVTPGKQQHETATVDISSSKLRDGLNIDAAAVGVVDQEKPQQDAAVGDISSSMLGEELEVQTTDVRVIDQEKLQEVTFVADSSSRIEEKHSVDASVMQTCDIVAKGLDSEVSQTMQGPPNSETRDENSKILQAENEDSNIQLDSEEPKPLQEDEGLKSTQEDVAIESTTPTKQVSEVNPNLGFQVKSDSISDSVLNEKIELEDNIIDDTVKLELDVVKPESVEPSPGNVVPVGGESHPMDSEEPQAQASVEEYVNDAIDADVNKRSDIMDMGDSEKLNLDGDDSMEDDVMDSRQIDSKEQAVELGDKIDNSEAPVLKKGNSDVVKDLSREQKLINNECVTHPILPPEKRKLHDQDSTGNIDSSKRQRRWNPERLAAPESQSLDHAPVTTPKDVFKPALRHSFSMADSSVSEDTPKERVVPPSQKPATTSLRIDHFLRPFTLKAVQELLGKTGKVEKFWMDSIKTHCFVSYSSVDEATETRNAVYNLQWPPNGGRLLVAEFVDPQEVKMRLEAPPQAASPITPNAAAPPPPTGQVQPSPRQVVSRERLPPPPPLPSPPPLSNPPLAREQPTHPPPPPPPPPPLEKHEPPFVTLDDLFRKTKATPRIYYLPLSDEQVAAKLAERGKHIKQ